MKIAVPEGPKFASLHLSFSPDGGLAEDHFLRQPEREAAAVIVQWYLASIADGGEPDAIAEQMLASGAEPSEPGQPAAAPMRLDTPAAFRTFCHSLGLSAKALAALAQVQERSVRHWWGDGQAPAGVVELVLRLDATMQDEAMLAIERVHAEAQERGQAPELVQLRAYRDEAALWQAMPTMRGWMPIQAHSVMLWRTAQALTSLGVKVEISYDKP